jgi:hypothetical protein
MCINGVNPGQFEQMIAQIDDHIALEYRWAHKLAHSAGDAGFATVSEKLHVAQMLLADLRGVIAEAKEALDADAQTSLAHEVTAHLV